MSSRMKKDIFPSIGGRFRSFYDVFCESNAYFTSAKKISAFLSAEAGIWNGSCIGNKKKQTKRNGWERAIPIMQLCAGAIHKKKQCFEEALNH